jgi:hypothetical protein
LCKRPSISHLHKNTKFVRDHHQMIINRISGVMVRVFASSKLTYDYIGKLFLESISLELLTHLKQYFATLKSYANQKFKVVFNYLMLMRN